MTATDDPLAGYDPEFRVCPCGRDVDPTLLRKTHWGDHRAGCPDGQLKVTFSPDGGVFRENNGEQLGCGREQLRAAYLAMLAAGDSDDPGDFERADAYYEKCQLGYALSAIVDLMP